MGKHTLGIVGFGGMGNWHRETIETIDCLSVKGVYDIKKERMDFAEECGLVAYESLDALLCDPEIDIVLVSTPNDKHKPIAVKALEGGKNVVSEKPVTLSLDDLNEMIAAAEKSGKLFTVHQNRRWDEDFLTVKKIIESGELGEIFRIESRVHGSRGIPGDWRQEPEHGGGMIYDWGIHIVDQILMMYEQKPVSVYCTVTNVTNQLVDDGFTAEFKYENGMTVLTEVGTSNFAELPRWYVLGQNGTAVVRDWSLNGEIVRCKDYSEKDAVPVKTAAGLTKTMAPRGEGSIIKRPLPAVKSDIRDYYKNICAAIEGKEDVIVTHSQQRYLMRVVEAMFDSAENNRVVTL